MGCKSVSEGLRTLFDSLNPDIGLFAWQPKGIGQSVSGRQERIMAELNEVVVLDRNGREVCERLATDAPGGGITYFDGQKVITIPLPDGFTTVLKADFEATTKQ